MSVLPVSLLNYIFRYIFCIQQELVYLDQLLLYSFFFFLYSFLRVQSLFMKSISDNPLGATKCSYLITNINFATIVLEVKGRK